MFYARRTAHDGLQSVTGSEERQNHERGGETMKLKKLGNQYLRADDITDGEIVTVTASPRYIDKTESKFGKEQYVVPVELGNGETKGWTANQTSWNRLVDAFGDEDDDWVGKKIMFRVKEQIVSGQDKKVLYGYAYAEPQQRLKKVKI
jgi:hypothetical protein